MNQMKNNETGRRGCGGQTDNTRRLSEIPGPLLQWYDANARVLPWRENPEPYRVWISEIMLQQTRVEAVKPYFDRWMKAFPDLLSLARASEAEVLKLWEGLGYYSRVRNIHRTAKLIAEKYSGSLPASFEELLTLPGIGEYTAGAIGSIAFQLPVPCVDGNVLRVVTRLTAEGADIGTAAAKSMLTGWVREIIPKDRPGDFNQAMMELGATVCLPNGLPKCESCPLAFLCEARIQDRITEFPVKEGKPPRKVEKKTVLILLNRVETLRVKSNVPPSEPEPPTEKLGAAFRVALRKRPDTGLLAGLWEFPNYDGNLGEEEVLQILEFGGLTVSSLVKLKKAKHIFTHIEWEMTGYLAYIESEGPAESGAAFIAESQPDYGSPSAEAGQSDYGFQWVETDHLEERLALPAAFKAYRQILKRSISEGENK
ncbi:MAG TPA: A/G-specific adenine glycosylase [Bacillota bacterium]|nr:A/G-specific adenine glycosylase [Bacillota bacterium]